MINGVHAIIFSEDAEGVRHFLRDVLALPSVDDGGGWLIFALPPAELAAHPDVGESRHELYLMCDDIATGIPPECRVHAKPEACGAALLPGERGQLKRITRKLPAHLGKSA